MRRMEPNASSQPDNGEMTHELIEARYYAALARDMGVGVAQFDVPATIVLPEQGRAGSGFVAAYRIRQATCLRADPALTAGIEALADPSRALSFADLMGWAEQSGWEVTDGADSHVIASSALARRPLPDRATVVSLDRNEVGDHSRIAELLASCDPDDVDAAEIELDDLDPLIVGLIDHDGRLG